MPNELLVRVRHSFQKLLQNRSRYRNNTKKNVCEKSNDALPIRVQTVADKRTDPYFGFYVFMFFTTIPTSKKMFSFRARAGKGIARHIDASGVVET